MVLRRVRRWCRQPVLPLLPMQHKLLPRRLPPPPPRRAILLVVSQLVQSQESSSVSSSSSVLSSLPSSVSADEGKQHQRIHKNSKTRNQISLLPLIRKKHPLKCINPPIPTRLRTLMSPWRSHLVLLPEPHEVHLKCLLFLSKLNVRMSVVNPDQSHPSRNRLQTTTIVLHDLPAK